MTWPKVFILFGALASGFLAPSEVAARDIGAKAVECVSSGNRDMQLEQMVEGGSGDVSSGVMGERRKISIEVRLSGGDVFTKDVYGIIRARYPGGDWINLFLRTEDNYQIVRTIDPLSLDVSVIYGSQDPLYLLVEAHLWDYNMFRPNWNLANGGVEFTLH